jgi:N-acetylmuramoyl-L-alanine amidase
MKKYMALAALAALLAVTVASATYAAPASPAHASLAASRAPMSSAVATRPVVRMLTPLVRANLVRKQKAHIVYALSEVSTMTVGLRYTFAMAGKTVRHVITGATATPATRTIGWTWDGLDDLGKAARRGRYTVTIVATDSAGATGTARGALVLGGFVVVIDAGHQAKADLRLEPVGPGSKVMKARVSGGATGRVTHNPESKITLAVALRLEKLLLARGLAVVMVRRRQSVDISNVQRAQIANRAQADLFLRIHLDGIDDTRTSGTSMQYPATNKWTKSSAKRSKSAAVTVQRYLVKSLGLKNRGLVARGDLAGFNWCRGPSILPELAFMSNAHDDRYMAGATGQQRAALGLTNGVVAFFYR